jgi:hypothetical protein
MLVEVDKLTKASHFVPVKTTHTTNNIVKIYMKEIARLHGIPRTCLRHRHSVYFKFLEGII